MIEWDDDIEYDDVDGTSRHVGCGCESWQQLGADGPWCGDCGHHISDHHGPDGCDPNA